MISFKRVYSKVKSPVYIKMFYLVLVAYIISLMQVNLTGGGEQFLLQQAQNGSYGNNVGACRHAVAFRVFGVLRVFRLAGW